MYTHLTRYNYGTGYEHRTGRGLHYFVSRLVFLSIVKHTLFILLSTFISHFEDESEKMELVIKYVLDLYAFQGHGSFFIPAVAYPGVHMYDISK